MEKPMKKEVLPCKNCNANNSEIQDYGVGPNNPWVWYVRCCLTCGWQPEAGTTELRANENWNNRAMSAWIEVELPSESGITHKINLFCKNKKMFGLKEQSELAEEIHSLLTQRLGGR